MKLILEHYLMNGDTSHENSQIRENLVVSWDIYVLETHGKAFTS